MLEKGLLLLLWLGFILYAFLFAPPDSPDTLTLIQQLSTGQWQEINPLLIALFNLMGIWPLIYSGILYVDGRGQRFPAWPFAIATFFLGAFVLLPYLIFRQSSHHFEGSPSRLIQFFDSRWMGGIIAFSALFLVGYGLLNGDWNDFMAQWQSSRFVNVMSLDFCCLSLLFPLLLKDDLTRRHLKNPLWFWGISSLPLFGATLYLILRPPLPVFNSVD